MKARRFLAVLAAGALIFAACSESEEDDGGAARGGGGGDGGGGETRRGVTDTEIKVGGLGYSAFYADSAVGAQARFARAERDGEIPGGRTINFIGFEDDNQDVNQDRDAATKLVQQDEIFAAVPVITPSLGGSEVFVDENVPFFGWGIAAGFCFNEVGFGFSGCLTPPEPEITSNLWGLLMDEYLGGADGKTAAVIAEDNDSGKAGVRVISTAAEDAGFEVVYSENPVPPAGGATPDFTPFANEILESADGEAPDVVFLVLAFSNVTGLSQKLTELGYDGALTNAVGYDPRLVSQFAGSTVFIQFSPFESAPDNPAMQQLLDDIAAFKPDQDLTMLTQPVAAGYFAADMFVEILKETGEDLTVERFLEVANDDFEWSIEDTAGPTTYPDGHERPTPCGSLIRSDGASYTIEVPFTCGEVIDIG